MGLSSFFIPLVVVAFKSAKSRNILGTFEIIVVQGHPKSSTFVPIESAYETSY